MSQLHKSCSIIAIGGKTKGAITRTVN